MIRVTSMVARRAVVAAGIDIVATTRAGTGIRIPPATDGDRIQTNLIVSPDPIFTLARITNLSLSQQWRGMPSGSLTVRSHKNQLQTLLDLFYPSRRLSAYGIDFVCGIASVEISRNALSMDIPLQSVWESYGETLRNPVDKPIQNNLGGISGNNSPPETERYYTINWVSRQAGINITNLEPYPIPLPTETDPTSTTTVKDGLEDVATMQGKFIDYTQADAIALKGFRTTPIHEILPWETRELSYGSTGGFGAEYNGIRLSKEFNNCELTVDQSSDPETGESTGREISIEGNPHPEIPPTINRGFYQDAYPLDYLRTPNHAFDNGGVTESRKIITTYNGEPIREDEETWGLVYNSLDTWVINVVSSNPYRYTKEFTGGDGTGLAQFWQKVSQTTTIHNYNSQGHYTGSITTGWKKERFKQESEQMELLELQIEALDPATGDDRTEIINRLKNLYEPQQIPSSSSTINTLNSMDLYYSDITDDSKFVKSSVATELSTRITEDPESTEDDPKPPLTVGTNKTELNYTTILSPLSKFSPQNPERLQTRKVVTDSSGQGFENFSSTDEISLGTGRPSTVAKLVLSPPTPRSPEQPQERYIVTTPNAAPVLPYIVTTESVGFTGGISLQKVLAGAQTQISFTNTEQAVTASVTLHNRKNWKAGDRVSVNGYIWVILSISESQEVRRDGNVYCSSYQLELGRFLDIPVTLRRRPTI